MGSAWGDKQLGRDAVSVAFFGDGAANQGVFLEGMNLAAIWDLPVIFLCENNQYTEWTSTKKLTAGSISERGRPLGYSHFSLPRAGSSGVRWTATGCGAAW